MKAFELQREFGLDHLEPVDKAMPSPGPGEVVVKLRAASLNYRDLMIIRGDYNPRMAFPQVPLSDGAGEIVELGPGVEGWQKGDRVMGLFYQGWTGGAPNQSRLRQTLGSPLAGMLQEYVCLPAGGVIATPAHLSDAEAACFPCAGLTAWSALTSEGSVRAGDTVLLQGTGGVSLFALQFAKLLGARVIITSSSDEKLERARALGADEGINYRRDEKWSKTVLEMTAGRGADHIIEVGGAGTIGQSLKAVRIDGMISVIGVLSGVAPTLPLTLVLMKHVRLQGILVGHHDSCAAMLRAVSQHAMKPVIDKCFPFADAIGAFEYMEQARHFGKICLTF